MLRDRASCAAVFPTRSGSAVRVRVPVAEILRVPSALAVDSSDLFLLPAAVRIEVRACRCRVRSRPYEVRDYYSGICEYLIAEKDPTGLVRLCV